MPRKKEKPQREVSLQMSPPELWRFEFVRHEVPPPPAWEQVPLVLGLGLIRTSAERLLVELSTEIKDVPSFYVHVVYRIAFHTQISDATPGELERELRVVVAQVAPATLYPFIREAVVAAMARAGLPILVLPLVNFRNIVSPKDVTIPPPPSDTQPMVDQGQE
jgi:Preprotein translocase subunit SecB